MFSRKPKGGFGCLFQLCFVMMVAMVLYPVVRSIVNLNGAGSLSGVITITLYILVIIGTMILAVRKFPHHF